MRLVRWCLLTVAAACSLGTVAAPAAGPPAGAAPVAQIPSPTPIVEGGDTWTRLGAPGTGISSAIALGPRWPEEPLLVVARGQELALMRGEGLSWERPHTFERDLRPPPIRTLSLLTFAPAGNPPSLFAWSDPILYRSADVGLTWTRPLRLEGPAGSDSRNRRAELSFSPEFARDSLALLVIDGTLYRSRDGGVTWETLEPVPGQRVQQAVFSPAYGQDRTLFAVAVSSGFSSVVTDRATDEPATDNEQSAGVLLSTDGGDSWTSVSAGLAFEGVPYRHVQRLAVSPTYPEDGTLFAYAWGPRELRPDMVMGGRGRVVTSRLFRSRDRGATWEAVYELLPSASRAVGIRFALSPRFATDGLALVAQNRTSFSPASSHCVLLRTADGGAQWTQVMSGPQYTGCDQFWMAGADAGLVAFVRQTGSGGWRISRDGGQTWGGFRPPNGGPTAIDPRMAITPSPAFARDRTVLVGAPSGLWAWQLACPSPAAGADPRAC